MIPVYRTITLSADANEDLVPKIYKILNEEHRIEAPKFTLDFVAFEAAAGTSFKINSSPLEVPSTGKFYSPYLDSKNFLEIRSLTFDKSVSNLKLYIIY